MSFPSDVHPAAPLKPQRLRPGETIGVIAPAGPLNEMRLQQLERGVHYLFEKGYKVVLGHHVREQQGYLAGTDKMRSDDLNDMLRRPDIQAIFCARGGYGLTRILDRIDYKAAQNHPKIILGYSDITALQMALYAKAGLITFSGPMVAVELGGELQPLTEESMWSMLTTNDLHVLADNNLHYEKQTLSPGRSEGPLLGGCLSVLVSLLGTPYMPELRGAILLLEDVGEDLYKIDRYLSQLGNAGILDSVNGVLLGQFINIAADENEKPLELQHVLDYYFASLNVPVLGNFPYGHTQTKVTAPLGCRVLLDADEKSVRLLESCLT